MIITAVDKSPLPNQSTVLEFLALRYGQDQVRLSEGNMEAEKVDYSVIVQPVGSTSFVVDKSRGVETLAINGTPEQNAEFAVGIRAALPEDFPRIVAVDSDHDGFVDLHPGIRTDQIVGMWRGFSEGDFQ